MQLYLQTRQKCITVFKRSVVNLLGLSERFLSDCPALVKLLKRIVNFYASF